MALDAEDVQAIARIVEQVIDKRLGEAIPAVMETSREGMVDRDEFDGIVRGLLDAQQRVVEWVQAQVLPDVMTGVVHEAWQRMVLGEAARLGLIGGVMREEVEDGN